MGYLIAEYNYWVYILLMMIGLYGMLAKNHLVKKVIGMSIFQTAIIVYYVSIGCKRNATIPILAHESSHNAVVQAAAYANPLPHVLMLTAIVVSVGTLGVALALCLNIHKTYGTLEEDEVMERLK